MLVIGRAAMLYAKFVASMLEEELYLRRFVVKFPSTNHSQVQHGAPCPQNGSEWCP